ncbi:SLATT domain-containing protein [Sporosarcina sp. SG10008]|uniref:SLATT domain-containing protein n=1 Tax=Sporosarcina sp. SG10008 TaxID=3373103 RepID=UPI0037DD3B05
MGVNLLNEEMIRRLSDKIWITRKCRINSSERLISTNRIAKFSINYFTLVVLSISIWTLYSNVDSNQLSFITVIASLFLFAGTIGVNSLNYKERIVNLKSCYIKLDELIGDLEILKNDLPQLHRDIVRGRFEIIRSSYQKILDEVENHNAYDYLKFQVSQKDFKKKTDYVKYAFRYVKYTLYNLGYILIILILTLFPFYKPIINLFRGWIK